MSKTITVIIVILVITIFTIYLVIFWNYLSKRRKESNFNEPASTNRGSTSVSVGTASEPRCEVKNSSNIILLEEQRVTTLEFSENINSADINGQLDDIGKLTEFSNSGEQQLNQQTKTSDINQQNKRKAEKGEHLKNYDRQTEDDKLEEDLEEKKVDNEEEIYDDKRDNFNEVTKAPSEYDTEIKLYEEKLAKYKVEVDNFQGRKTDKVYFLLERDIRNEILSLKRVKWTKLDLKIQMQEEFKSLLKKLITKANSDKVEVEDIRNRIRFLNNELTRLQKEIEDTPEEEKKNLLNYYHHSLLQIVQEVDKIDLDQVREEKRALIRRVTELNKIVDAKFSNILDKSEKL